MQIIKIKQGQSLFDIAIEHCGSIDAVMQIALLNNLSVTDYLSVGQLLKCPTFLNKKAVDYYTRENIYPANAKNVESIINGGIGYMQIGTNFIVS